MKSKNKYFKKKKKFMDKLLCFCTFILNADKKIS